VVCLALILTGHDNPNGNTRVMLARVRAPIAGFEFGGNWFMKGLDEGIKSIGVTQFTPTGL
jgi:hypothetical protein